MNLNVTLNLFDWSNSTSTIRENNVTKTCYGKTKSFVTGDKTRNNFGKTKKFCDSKSKDLTKQKFIRFCAGCFRNKPFFLSNCVLTEGGYAALNVFFPHYLQKDVLNIKKLSGLQ